MHKDLTLFVMQTQAGAHRNIVMMRMSLQVLQPCTGRWWCLHLEWKNMSLVRTYLHLHMFFVRPRLYWICSLPCSLLSEVVHSCQSETNMPCYGECRSVVAAFPVSVCIKLGCLFHVDCCTQLHMTTYMSGCFLEDFHLILILLD